MPGHSGKLIGMINKLDSPVREGTEVGVWLGRNSRVLLNQFPELVLNLVDCYDDKLLEPALQSRFGAGKAERIAHRILRDYEDRCRWFKQQSIKAAKRVQDASQDFVFIDANHDYESVRDDIEAWMTKVRPGGLLCGHDYNSVYFEGCVRAVDEAFGNRIKVTKGRFPVWWLFV